jgi:integrase
VVFGWAVANTKLPSNPAIGVKVMRSKTIRTRSKGFTDSEAKAILFQCLHHQRHGREGGKMLAAKRWVPWLCAYTGARVGEVVQLRKQDVAKEGDNWVMTITPEANTVKDKEVRQVILHAHLVEQGFADFVESAQAGYLFLTLPKGGDVRKPWRTTKNRLREFVRKVVKDPNVAPNHGWRHLFKTIGREAGISDSILDAITGHAPKTVGGSYGDVTLKAQVDAMAKFPRFKAA